MQHRGAWWGDAGSGRPLEDHEGALHRQHDVRALVPELHLRLDDPELGIIQSQMELRNQRADIVLSMKSTFMVLKRPA